MVNFKLTYFDISGLAEPIRFLFAYGGIDFEDIRINRGEEWEAVKSEYPFEQLPLLEVDDVKINQSVAIARYVAKQVELTGSTDVEDALIDSAVDNIIDLRNKIMMVYLEQNEEVKEEKREKLKQEIIPFYLSKLETMIEENNGHLAIGRLTWADVFLAASVEILQYAVGEEFLSSSSLNDLADKVREIPSIKEWITNRPADSF